MRESRLECFVPAPVRASATGRDGAVGSPDVLKVVALSELIAALAVKTGPEGVIIWGTYLFPYGLAAYLAAEITREHNPSSRFWLTPSGSDVWELAQQFRDSARLLLNRADRVITYSNSFIREIQHELRLSRHFDRVTPIVDVRRFHPVDANERCQRRAELGIPEDSFVISHHSNMRSVKRPEVVLEVARAVSRELKAQMPVTLLLMGPRRPLFTEVTSDPLHIVHLGVVQHVAKYLQAANVELNMSVHDSFNLSLAEAMACGLPVVTTDAAGIAPAIVSCEGGFVVETQKPSDTDREVVRSLVALARDPARAATLGSAARNCAIERFSEAPELIHLAYAVSGRCDDDA